jgi:hypothetical protein
MATPEGDPKGQLLQQRERLDLALADHREQDDHHREGQAVVDAAFHVEQVPQPAGDVAAADDGGREHRIAGTEHGPDQPRLGPGQAGHVVRE